MTRSRWDRYRSPAEVAAAEREARRGVRRCLTPEALQEILGLRLGAPRPPCLLRLAWPRPRRGCTCGPGFYQCEGCGHRCWWRDHADNWNRDGRLMLVTSHVYPYARADMLDGLRDLVADNPGIGAALLPQSCSWYARDKAHLILLYNRDLEPELETFEHFSAAYHVPAGRRSP